MWQRFLDVLFISFCFVNVVKAEDIDETVTVSEGEDALIRCPFSISPELETATLISWFRLGQQYFSDPIEILLTKSPVFPEFNEENTTKVWFEEDTATHYWNMRMTTTRYNDSGLYGCVLRYPNYETASFDTQLIVTPSQPLNVSSIPPERRESIVYDVARGYPGRGSDGLTLNCSLNAAQDAELYWVKVEESGRQQLLVWGDRRTVPDNMLRGHRLSQGSSSLFIKWCCYNEVYEGDYVCAAEGTNDMKLIHLEVLMPTTTTTTTQRWYPIRWEN